MPTLLTSLDKNTLTALDQILHVRDEKASGTQGGPSVAGANIRVLNTVVRNTIPGASLASNQITLPAGTYTCTASAPFFQGNGGRIRLVNVTDSSVLILGLDTYADSTVSVAIHCPLFGVFTLASPKVINLTHQIELAKTTNGLGVYTSDTFVQVFASVFITKIA